VKSGAYPPKVALFDYFIHQYILTYSEIIHRRFA